ncbi:phytoene desaturase family protein [Bacillus sp. DJP31]|uniref:phytoene desaturase family protein n=1 Tax=Bacillus sp. DJP31 TaxID=3409789 RepID=UPI003BB77F1E
MKIAIVGGGIGGLISALLLSKKGYEVEIFEAKKQLGGRLSFVEKDGFRIDKGPTIVLLPDMLREILDEAGIASNEYELLLCDPMYSLHFTDGTTYTKYPTVEQQVKEISRVFPGEEEAFKRYMNDMKIRFLIGKKAFLEKSFVTKSSFYTTSNLRNLVNLKAYQSVTRQVKSYFKHPYLQESYRLQTLYIGGNPNTAPALYNLIPYSEHEHGIWYVKGGYASLVSLIHRELNKRGVSIHLEKHVERLTVQDSQATGLIVDGNDYEFDRIILNGDFPLVKKLVPDQLTKKTFEPSSGCYLLYIGLSKVYEKTPLHQFFMCEDFNTHMKQVFQTKEVPVNPSFYTFYPTVVDPTTAPAGKSILYVLIPVPSGQHIDWEQSFIKERILEQLEDRGFPELQQHIEWIETRDPSDAEKDGLYEGGSFGIAPTLMQSGVFRPQVKPFQLSNVYAVGASIHPGGGIPIVMQGAKLAVEMIMEDAPLGRDTVESISESLSSL